MGKPYQGRSKEIWRGGEGSRKTKIEELRFLYGLGRKTARLILLGTICSLYLIQLLGGKTYFFENYYHFLLLCIFILYIDVC